MFNRIRAILTLTVLVSLPGCAAFVEYHAAAGIKCDNPRKPAPKESATPMMSKGMKI